MRTGIGSLLVMQLHHLVLHIRCDACLQDEYRSGSILYVCDLCAIIGFTRRDGENSGVTSIISKSTLRSFLENCKAKFPKIKINC
jgi:hypothetical protein